MKTCIITGANRGLGLALAQILSQRPDWRVWGTTRRASPPIKGIQWAKLDVTSILSVSQLAVYFSQSGDALDLLINNAATLELLDEDILKLTHSGLMRTLETNVYGALLMAQGFWPGLKRAGGRVLNISSTDALCLDECRPAYAVSKIALEAVTKKLALAGKRDGVTVSSVQMGWFRSGMGTDKAPMSADEAAAQLVKETGI